MARVALALLLFAVTAFGQSSSKEPVSALPKAMTNDPSIFSSYYGTSFDYPDLTTSWDDRPCSSDDYDIGIYEETGLITGGMDRDLSLDGWHDSMMSGVNTNSGQSWLDPVDPTTNSGRKSGWFYMGYAGETREQTGGDLSWDKLTIGSMRRMQNNPSFRQSTTGSDRGSVGPSRRAKNVKGAGPSRRPHSIVPSVGGVTFFVDPYEYAAKAVMDVLEVTPGFDAARRAGLQLRELQATASQRFMLRIAELRSLVAK